MMNIKIFFKKLIAVGTLSAAALTFAACGGSNASVAGAWETDDGHTVVFEENGEISGTGMYSGSAKYKVNGNKITMYLEQDGEKMEIEGTISGDAIVFKGDTGTATMYKK